MTFDKFLISFEKDFAKAIEAMGEKIIKEIRIELRRVVPSNNKYYSSNEVGKNRFR